MQSFQSKNIKLFSLQTIYTYSMVAFLYCIPIYYIYLLLCGAVHLYLLLRIILRCGNCIMKCRSYGTIRAFKGKGKILQEISIGTETTS